MKREKASFGSLRISASLLLLLLPCGHAVGEVLSGTYRTPPGSTATYQYQPDTIHNVTLPLDVTMEFSGDDPTTTVNATIHIPIIGILPDGTPLQGIANDFPMEVTGTSSDGRSFQGDLLGTQYLFDWQIEQAEGGELRWNGVVGWSGGRIELTTITDARLAPISEPAAALTMLLGAMTLLAARNARRLRPKGRPVRIAGRDPPRAV